MISWEEDFSIDEYQELVNEYGYKLKITNTNDSILVDNLIATSINDHVVSCNKYRFSKSQEYSVPKKASHQDIVEFIKVEKRKLKIQSNFSRIGTEKGFK